MENKFDWKKTITIPHPPSEYIHEAKRKIDPKTLKLKSAKYYLTANLFMGNSVHYHTQAKIMKFAKNYLLMYFQGLPKLEKLRVKIIYYRMDEGFDLDNKAYFWLKNILDILKTPTTRQLLAAKKKNQTIISLEILKDDNVGVIDDIRWKFKRGEHKIVIKLKGRKMNEQRRLFI